MGLILILMVSYIIFSIHGVRLVDDGESIYIIFSIEKYNSDGLPYTSIQKITIWRRKKL